ncbi:MAG: methyltransferase domain-containing protein [Candidatus Hodarchaeota archaeon]
MKKPLLKILRCPKCRTDLISSDVNSEEYETESATLVCKKGHTWEVKEGIPSLVYPAIRKEDARWIAEYDAMAETYDEAIKSYNTWLGIDIMKERENFAQFIPIEGPAKIIDVSIGTGANFVALHKKFKGKSIGRFGLYGLDLSTGMLRVSKKKFEKNRLPVSLVHGSVFNIPYKDNSFDIVIHSGGINTFSDIGLAMREMLRVVEPSGFVIINDEGLSPEMRASEKGKSIIEANSLFAARPPLEYIPDKARDVEVSYVMNNTFYQIVFRK